MSAAAAVNLVQQALKESSSQAAVSALRELPIPEIVAALQPELTGSVSEKAVTSAMSLLAQCAIGRSEGTANPLNTAAVVTLLQFYGVKCTRLATLDVAVECVLLILSDLSSRLPNLGEWDVVVVAALLADFLPHVHVQSVSLNTRKRMFTVYELTLKHAKSALHAPCNSREVDHARKFLKQWLTSVDGERDPSLLLRAFAMHETVASTFPPDTLTFLLEDLFDSMSAYFPVLFTPPPGSLVTRDQLRTALSRCMRLPLFHPVSVSFVCQKLGSPSMITKEDSIELLRLFFTQETNAEELAPYMGEVLTALRSETLKLNAAQEHNPDLRDLLRSVLATVTAVAHLAGRMAKEPSQLLSVLEPIVGTTLSMIETDSSSGRSYATLIHALGRASPTCTAALVTYFFPLLSGLIVSPSSVSSAGRRKENCLAVLGAILSACDIHLRSRHVDPLVVGAPLPSPLTPQPLVSLKDQLLNESALRSSVLAALRDYLATVILQGDSNQVVLRIAAESLATWIVLARRLNEYGSRWGSKTECMSACISLFTRALAFDVPDDSAEVLMTALSGVVQQDLSLLPGLFERDGTPCWLSEYYPRPRLTLCLRVLTTQIAPTKELYQRALAVLVQQYKAVVQNGGLLEEHVDLLPLCDQLVTKASKSIVWEDAFLMEILAELDRAQTLQEQIAAFDVAVLLVSVVKDWATFLAPALQGETLNTLGKLVVCGLSRDALKTCTTSVLSSKWLEQVCEEATASSSSTFAVSPAHRCVSALANKAAIEADTVKSLAAKYASEGRWDILGCLCKGLLSSGAAEMGQHIAALLLQDTDSLFVQNATSQILGRPQLSVSTPMWAQRFYSWCVDRLTSGGPSSGHLAVLAKLSAVADPTWVRVSSSKLFAYCSSSAAQSPRSHTSGLVLLLAALPSPSVELFLARNEAAMEDVLAAASPCLDVTQSRAVPLMEVRVAALRLLRTVAVFLKKQIEEGAKTGDNKRKPPTSEAAVGRMEDGGGAEQFTASQALSVSHQWLKVVLRRTQTSLKDVKRAVRAAAGSCRHEWLKLE